MTPYFLTCDSDTNVVAICHLLKCKMLLVNMSNINRRYFRETWFDSLQVSVTSIDSLLVRLTYIDMCVTRIDTLNLFQVHSLFSLLSLHHAYVTNMGRLVGIISLKEVRTSH